MEILLLVLMASLFLLTKNSVIGICIIILMVQTKMNPYLRNNIFILIFCSLTLIFVIKSSYIIGEFLQFLPVMLYLSFYIVISLLTIIYFIELKYIIKNNIDNIKLNKSDHTHFELQTKYVFIMGKIIEETRYIRIDTYKNTRFRPWKLIRMFLMYNTYIKIKPEYLEELLLKVM
jgi:hypothetical protein